MTVSEPPSTIARAAASARRAAARRQAVERVDQQHGVAAAGGDALRRLDRALDRLRLRVGAGARRARAATGSTGPSRVQSAASSGRTPASTTLTSSSVAAGERAGEPAQRLALARQRGRR